MSLIFPSLSITLSLYLSRASPHVLRPPQTHSIMVSHVLCMRALVWFRRPGWRKRMYLSVCVCVCARSNVAYDTIRTYYENLLDAV